jgi:hypothetical protein
LVHLAMDLGLGQPLGRAPDGAESAAKVRVVGSSSNGNDKVYRNLQKVVKVLASHDAEIREHDGILKDVKLRVLLSSEWYTVAKTEKKRFMDETEKLRSEGIDQAIIEQNKGLVHVRTYNAFLKVGIQKLEAYVANQKGKEGYDVMAEPKLAQIKEYLTAYSTSADGRLPWQRIAREVKTATIQTLTHRFKDYARVEISVKPTTSSSAIVFILESMMLADKAAEFYGQAPRGNLIREVCQDMLPPRKGKDEMES